MYVSGDLYTLNAFVVFSYSFYMEYNLLHDVAHDYIPSSTPCWWIHQLLDIFSHREKSLNDLLS
jgi:hypothetical protein